MNVASRVTEPVSAQGPRLVRGQAGKSALARGVFFLYILMLGGLAARLYHSPVYSMDSIQYMGNALLMDGTDIVRIHERVYADIRRNVPNAWRDGLLGHEAGAPENQNRSRQERAANANTFAEFLPLFAIRPLYVQTLWLMSKTGMGLVRSGIVISVVSYFLLGIIAFVWIGRYMSAWFTLAISVLLMMSPPVADLGREIGADGMATLVAFASLYFIFEARRMLPGMILLLASIYFRTDFIVLAGPVILACWWERRMDFWKAGTLAAVAVASVLCINHFAGDYGIKMLYYRNFVSVPITPGEMTVHFSLRDYFAALRSGITLAANSFFFPFLLLGTIGMVMKRMRVLFAVALSYACLHFVILPNWEERWFGLFYLSMGMCAAVAVGILQRDGRAGAEAR